MIRLIFTKDDQAILQFSLDNQGNYFNVVGDDSWFNYDYQKNGLSRHSPRLWAEMLKSGYAKNGIDVEIVFDQEESAEKKSLNKLLLIVPLIGLVIALVLLLPSFVSSQGPKSSVLIKKSRDNILKEIKTGSGEFKLSFAGLNFRGSFDRGQIQLINSGPGIIRESIWSRGFLYQKNQNGQWSKKRINGSNEFPLRTFLTAILNPKISLQQKRSSAGLKFIDSEYEIKTKATRNSGVVAKGSNYLLTVEQGSYLPKKIAVSKLFRPFLFVGRNVSIQFLNFDEKTIRPPTTSQVFQSRG